MLHDLPSRPQPLWAPLAAMDFRALYAAIFITMTCSWMNTVGSAWAMTVLRPSAVMLGLVTASFTLPGVLFSLPGGVLADKIDRRWFAILTAVALVLVSLSIAFLESRSWMSPGLLLTHTFLIGTVFSLQGPTLLAIIQDMVRRDVFIQALTLNSIALNVGRAVGPAIAGAVIAGIGISWLFVINAAGFCVMVIAVVRWRPTSIRQVVRESYGRAFLDGLYFGVRETRFRNILIRFGFYLSCASMLMVLMPLVAKARLGGGPQAFGALITWVGIGAVVAAVARGRTTNMLSPDGHVRVSAVMTGLGILAMAFADTLTAASAAALLYGAGWTNGSVTYQVAAQMSLPAAMRGRGVSLYLMMFSFGMMVSGLFWGMVADLWDIRVALIGAGAVGLALDLACGRIRIATHRIDESNGVTL